MNRHVYRGASLTQFNDAEFSTGKVPGREVTVYTGSVRDRSLPAHVSRGTPLSELPLWTPDGAERLWMEDTVEVTGGITGKVGTAMTFAGAVPMVLYLSESRVNASPVRYTRDWFSTGPGTYAWVYGDRADGEIHYQDEGLVGAVSESPSGPEVEDWVYGDRNLGYPEEQEWVVRGGNIRVGKALDGTASFIQERSVDQLAEAVDVEPRGSRAKTLLAAHSGVRAAAEADIAPYWIVVLNAVQLEQFDRIQPGDVTVATDGDRVVEGEDVPDWVLGA